MADLDDSLRARVAAWRAEDPDAATRAELDRLVADGDAAPLVDAFTGTLEFGTAGLRGLLGPGPNRMNRLVVARATVGVVAHLLATVPDAKTRGIAIGFDGRRMSREFAADVAAIAAGAGVRALAFDETVATPVLAFAVKHHGAAAGVMITASHNPPAYNGYKVYWENGAQIIPPIDAGIAAEIARAPHFDAIPRLARADAVAQELHVTLGGKTEARLPRRRESARTARGRGPHAAHRVHGAPRCGRALRAHRDGGARLLRGRERGRAGRARRCVSDRRLPEPRGEGRDGPGARARARDGRRPRPRQRPRRRPARRRDSGRVDRDGYGSSPATRSASARALPAHGGRPDGKAPVVASVDRQLSDARRGRAKASASAASRRSPASSGSPTARSSSSAPRGSRS